MKWGFAALGAAALACASGAAWADDHASGSSASSHRHEHRVMRGPAQPREAHGDGTPRERRPLKDLRALLDKGEARPFLESRELHALWESKELKALLEKKDLGALLKNRELRHLLGSKDLRALLANDAARAKLIAWLTAVRGGLQGGGAPPVAPSPTGPDVKLRALVIAADGKEANLPAITQALDYLGTPYTLWIASQKAGALTTNVLATGTVGNYSAVFLTDAALGYLNGATWTSALSAAEWKALYDYEAAFHVRQVNWYAWPTADLGFAGAPQGIDAGAAGLEWSLTDAGAPLFPYLAGTAPIRNAWVYLAQADAAATPLLTDANGNALAVLKTWPEGREAITLAFDSAPWLTHTQILSYGLVRWATRGVFLGERREVLAAQVDDVFLASDLYTGGEYRISGGDLSAVNDWQQGWSASSYLPGFRLDLYFNGEGATALTSADATDDLTPVAQDLQAQFKWGSHTYTHQNLDATSYDVTHDELAQNVALARQLRLTTFSAMNLVQPEVSGLTNPIALQAMADFGIRYVVADTSKPGQSAGPNLGIWNQLQPAILEIPRFPTNLYYNVSTPEEWVTEYNVIYRGYWGRDLAYDEILDKESEVMLSYLLKGAQNPLMFHQANLRLYDGAHTLLGDLIDRTMEKYLALYDLPVASPTMDELGVKFGARMKAAAAGVEATLRPGVSITLRAQKAATVMVTGACTAKATRIGGECIAPVSLAAGQTVTVRLQ